MNAIALLFFVAVAGTLIAVPRRWAPVPLLIGCCYMTTGQGVELGPISLPMIRLLLLVGLVRVIVRGERAVGAPNTIDWLVIAFAGWIMLASFFHSGVAAGPVYSAGIVFNVGLVYYLMRVFCRTTEELVGLIKVIAIILVPVAIEMLFEKLTGKNLFAALFGGVSENVVLRNDRLRARGPFRHAILAGTVGATCFPLMYAIRQRAPLIAKIGMVATLFMVIASASSGPIMTLVFALGGMCLWAFRHWSRYIPIVCVTSYIAIELIMTRPAYYLSANIDLAGGSTGWHRARLIEAAITHFNEWWLFGTDFTRHWMPTGITFSANHTDITNYFLLFGVTAGFPALLLMLAMLWVAFAWVGKATRVPKDLLTRNDRRLIWFLGAGMFAHAMTGLSVAYYDQSYVFFWFNLAVISSFHSVLVKARKKAARATRLAKAASAPGSPPPAPAPTGGVPSGAPAAEAESRW